MGKGQCKYANWKRYATLLKITMFPLFVTVCKIISIFVLSVTFCQIFAIEVCLTLTFRMGQDQMKICQSKGHTWLSVGNSNVCPICHRLWDIHTLNVYDHKLELYNGSRPYVNMPTERTHATFCVSNRNVFPICHVYEIYSHMNFAMLLDSNFWPWKWRSRTLTISLKIGKQTYFVDVHMWTNIGASTSSNLFLVTFRVRRTYIHKYIHIKCLIG